MNELWVARDLDFDLWQFTEKPEWIGELGMWACGTSRDDCDHIDRNQHPDLKPGECRRLVLAEDASE